MRSALPKNQSPLRHKGTKEHKERHVTAFTDFVQLRVFVT